MIKVLKTSTISIAPGRQAFWFFFNRLELTVLRLLAYFVIMGLTFLFLGILGLPFYIIIPVIVFEAIGFYLLGILVFRASMKIFRDAFRQKSEEEILASLDALAAEMRAKRLWRMLGWFLCIDNAWSRDIFVASAATSFARWTGRTIDAQERCNAIIEICPDHIMSWHYLGELSAEGGDITTAEHYFEKATESCPAFHYSNLTRAAWLYAYEKPVVARELVSKIPAREKARFSALPFFAAVFSLAEDKTDEILAQNDRFLDQGLGEVPPRERLPARGVVGAGAAGRGFRFI